MATIVDVAKRAGVSLSTASDILNGKLKGTAETAGRVRQAVLELGYRPNLLARRLRTAKAGAIGLVVPFRRPIFTSAVIADYLAGIQAEQERADLNLVLASRRYEKPGEIYGADLFESRSVDGLIVIATRESYGRDVDADVRGLRAMGCPLVWMHFFEGREPVDRVTRAGADAWHEVLEHLAERGHKKVGALTVGIGLKAGGRPNASHYAKRFEAFGMRTQPEWLGAGEAFDGGAFGAAMAILRRPADERPTAIVCEGDELAVAALQAALGMSIKVPGELAIASVTNTSIGATAAVPITTHGAPGALLGRMALKRLAELIADPTQPVREVAVPGQLIVRAST